MILVRHSTESLRCNQPVLLRSSQPPSLSWTHTHPFNGPLSGTTQLSRYQKGKTNLDFTEGRDSEWQWYQLGHMQACILLQTDNHASTPPLKFFYRPDALPAAQPTLSKHWRHSVGKRATQSYIVSRRDGNSCLGNRKKLAIVKWAFIYVMLSRGCRPMLYGSAWTTGRLTEWRSSTDWILLTRTVA